MLIIEEVGTFFIPQKKRSVCSRDSKKLSQRLSARECNED